MEIIKIYRDIEAGFEKLASATTRVLGNSITFIIAVCMVLLFLISKEFYMQNMHKMIGDIIMSMTFLTLFLVQKSFNRFSGSLHLKVNELVASHEPANNALVNVESKTEHEILELAKEYKELAEHIQEEEALAEHIKEDEIQVAKSTVELDTKKV